MDEQFQVLFDGIKIEKQTQTAELNESPTKNLMDRMDEKLTPINRENYQLKQKVNDLEKEMEHLKRENKSRLRNVQFLNPRIRFIPKIKFSTSTCDPSCGRHQITYKPYIPLCYKDHDHKNMTLNRPMSPHLTVYAPTLPAMTSILQRITGVILTFYALLLAGGTLFLPNGIDTYVAIIKSFDLSSTVIVAVKCILGLPFGFHYFNALRFVSWNAGKLLSMKMVYSSAYLSWVLAVGLAIFFAML